PVDLPRMGGEFFVHAMFGRVEEEVEILITCRGKETVGVVELPDFTVGLSRSQPIAKDFDPFVDEGLEKAQRLEFLHRISPFGLVWQSTTSQVRASCRKARTARPRRSWCVIGCIPRRLCG